MIKIPLGNSASFGLVDDEDKWVLRYNFWLSKEGYICYWNGRKQRKLHQLIMKINDPNISIDHKNQDKLNNCKSNLRLCTRSQNMANRKLNENNTSGFKGVWMRYGKWTAQIGHQGKRLHIGDFDTPQEAAKAYDLRATELKGEFARLNFD